MEITDASEVRAVLADPAWLVPEAPAGGAPGGIAWLRASVSRHCNGEAHRRRRALACAELERIDLAGLRAAARASGSHVDALAAALGVAVPVGPQVAIVAAAYHPHLPAGPEADLAVARLVEAFGGVCDERTAVRISLLVQACDATAALIAGALPKARAMPVEDALRTALRDDPPVRATRRVRAGAPVTLALDAAPFGSGPRSCPGREHALALAAGVLEAPRS